MRWREKTHPPHRFRTQSSVDLDWCSHIDDFKVRHLQWKQIVRTETDVGILCYRVLIALGGKCDIAAVGEEHAVFLHGARDDLRRGS